MKEEADYKLLKENLERGDIKKLREEFGLSKSSASRILRGTTKNGAFMEALLAKAAANKLRIESGKERLKSIGA